jgi:signal transduction histidine kinase
MAHAIVSGIGEIERIIADLLEYARETRLDLQTYPLERILAPVLETAAAGSAPGAPRVEVRGLSAGIAATVDGPRLRQVFANVFKNAVEATERRPLPCVAVAVSVRGSAAVIEVTDNGVGMDPADRDKIFLPFYTTKSTGTGLGMAIVKKIMDLHGGEVEIESTPGVGTTVRLVIPRAAPFDPRTQEEPHEASHSHR